MKRILLFSFCLLSFFLQTVWGQKGALTEVRQVVERVTGQSDLPVSFVLKLDKGANYFQYRVDNGVLKIEGSNPVALCRGFYDFVKSNRAGLYSWSGSNICFPQQLVDGMEKRIVSPFEHHYLFNVCTYGYSMPYWDWERWEKEIDWMVLHGINLPLAITGTDVVWYQVLNLLGYSKEEINSFIAGPAFQAWWLMNNLEGWGGPNPDSWYKQQADLQKKIVKRMCEYGIEPVLPGYASEKGGLRDYAHREWSGLLKDVYYVRWKTFFDQGPIVRWIITLWMKSGQSKPIHTVFLRLMIA